MIQRQKNTATAPTANQMAADRASMSCSGSEATGACPVPCAPEGPCGCVPCAMASIVLWFWKRLVVEEVQRLGEPRIADRDQIGFAQIHQRHVGDQTENPGEAAEVDPPHVVHVVAELLREAGR